jgi:amino acid adenylation domain-containing protein
MARYEFPASYAQRRMWVLDQLDPGRPTYNVGWAVWLDGPLDATALTGAWTAAVGRHEALRTVFRDVGGVPVQVVDDDPPGPPVPVLSLTDLPADVREARAREILREHASVPFDLACGPLVRVQLLQLAPDQHLLSLVAHHIIADGWSFRLLFAELAADYGALCEGRPPGTAEPDVQYADFTLWQLEHDDAGGYTAAEAFWRAELAGAPPELALPVDHPYPAREGFAADEVDVSVDAPTAAALRRLARDRGTTLFSVLVAGYAALLSRLAGTDDLLIGVPVAGRTRAETEPVVGLFVNTLAIRADVCGDPTLGQLADRMHAATARALAHQELPFARVVELCHPERQQARAPLVQVMCAVEDAWPVLERGRVRWQPELIGNGTSKFELELTVLDSPTGPGSAAGLDARLRYRTDLFTPATARLLAAGLGRTLAALAATPDTRVSEVDILPPDVRELVTKVWPPGAGPAAADPAAADRSNSPSLTALVAGACVGDRVLIRGSDGEFTGAQLRSRAELIAAGLTGLGVRVQDTVGILLPRGARVLPALLGAWWAGAAYLPIDPTHPARRIRGMLADAGVRILITDRAALGPLLSELDSDLAILDMAGTTSGTGPATGPVTPPDLPPEAAAYVLFTSGSTGRPKAVTVTHGSLGALLLAFREMVPLGPSDRVGSVTTFAFDIAVLELLLPLLAGALVSVADADQARDGGLLRRMLTATGVTFFQGTPATWRLLVDGGGVPDGVRLRLSGGDRLPRDLADVLLRGPDVRLWNLYGPTETTIYCTAGPVAPGSRPLDIGTAIGGARCYLLDRWLNPVAPGVVAEVYVGGDLVSRGYAGAPGLTAGRYLPDPFGGQPGARLYRTGDLGRWLPNGRIEPFGRVDRQVKIRGYRVETAEIEAALRTHPDVGDAVATTVTGAAPGDVRLVGYVVTGLADPSTVLREHLRHLLPEYMIPATFVPLPELPRTRNGKVDHRALPEPRWASTPGAAKVAPRTPLEQELADLVAAVLRRSDPVDALDNFFALGGHSLTATQLMARIWTAYGVDLPVRTLFDDPTVAGLAAAVTAAGGSAAAG